MCVLSSILMNTFKRRFLVLTFATVLVAPIWAQTGERRANLTGGGSNDAGKCTVEVYVDGSAEVEIRGDRSIRKVLQRDLVRRLSVERAVAVA